jgi:response regulator of citrate/malate metabolism
MREYRVSGFKNRVSEDPLPAHLHSDFVMQCPWAKQYLTWYQKQRGTMMMTQRERRLLLMYMKTDNRTNLLKPLHSWFHLVLIEL